MKSLPKVSIVIPVYDMPNARFFLQRCLDSVVSQTFTDYEILVTRAGGMAENTNNGMRRAEGEIVKLLYMDDYFSSEFALEDIVIHFNDTDHWMITGCDTNPVPMWTDDIHLGNNKLGSPSCLSVRRSSMLFFDEKLSWLLDCDLYKRLYDKYGIPKILDAKNITIGVGDHQATNLMTDEYKLIEHKYMQEKYQ